MEREREREREREIVGNGNCMANNSRNAIRMLRNSCAKQNPWKKLLRQHFVKTGLKMTTPIVVRVCHLQKLVGKLTVENQHRGKHNTFECMILKFVEIHSILVSFRPLLHRHRLAWVPNNALEHSI